MVNRIIPVGIIFTIHCCWGKHFNPRHIQDQELRKRFDKNKTLKQNMEATNLKEMYKDRSDVWWFLWIFPLLFGEEMVFWQHRPHFPCLYLEIEDLDLCTSRNHGERNTGWLALRQPVDVLAMFDTPLRRWRRSSINGKVSTLKWWILEPWFEPPMGYQWFDHWYIP